MSKKITQLDEVIAANITDVDVFPIVSAGITQKAKVSSLRTKIGEEVYNVKNYGLLGDTTTDNRAVLNTLVNTTIPSAGGTVIFPAGTYRIATSITIPRNIVLDFRNGAILTADGGATVTIDGTIRDTRHKIFSGAGVFRGVAMQTVRPDWWGALADGATNDQAAWQAAHDALPGNGGKILAPYGLSIITSSITSTKNNVWIHGLGRHHRADNTQASTIFYTGISFAIIVSAGQGFWLDGVRIFTNQNGGSGLRAVNNSGGKISGCYFSGVGKATSTGKGIEIDDGQIWIIEDVQTQGYVYGVDFLQNNGLCTVRHLSSNFNLVGLRMGNTARSAAVNVFQSDFEQNDVANIDIINCLNTTISQCYFEDIIAGAVSIRIGPTAAIVPETITIENNYFYGNTIANNAIQLNRVAVLNMVRNQYNGYTVSFIKNNGTAVGVLNSLHNKITGGGAASFTSYIDNAAGIGKMYTRTERTTAPSTAGGADPGIKGEWYEDGNFIYIATNTNAWKRVALAAF